PDRPALLHQLGRAEAAAEISCYPSNVFLAPRDREQVARGSCLLAGSRAQIVENTNAAIFETPAARSRRAQRRRNPQPQTRHGLLRSARNDAVRWGCSGVPSCPLATLGERVR